MSHSTGRLIPTARKSLGLVTVDCTRWDTDMLADRCSTGRLARSLTESQPVTAGAFIVADSLHLEIAIWIEPEVKQARAFALAAQLITQVLASDPGLVLTYNAALSRVEVSRG
jgi:hypothetical protein